jgi:Na+-driven multidrug efflux pump
LSYASPLLFKRWIERPDASEAMKGGILVFLTLGTLALAARVILNHYQLEFLFGKYAMLAGILWIVLIAAAFDGFQRALVAYVYAQGFPWLPATSEMSRMLVIAAGLAFWPVQQVGDVAWIVCFAATVSSTVLLIVHLWVKYTTKGLAT